MGSFQESFKASNNPIAENDGWVPKMEPVYPQIVAALEGEGGWERDKQLRPPLTLMIMNRDGKLKFTLSNPEWDRTYHGLIQDASEPLMSVERALAANQGEWVKKRQNGSGTGRRG